MNDVQRAKALLLEETCETCRYQSCLYSGSWYMATKEQLQSCYLRMTNASFEWEEEDDRTRSQKNL
jgi:hypothetical protein